MPAVRTQRAHRDALVCLASEKYYNGDEPTYGALEYEINDIDANGAPLERRECDVHLFRPNVLGHSTARTLQPANPCCECIRVGDRIGPSLLDSTLSPDGSIKIGTPGARLLLQRRKLVTKTECASAHQAAGVSPLPGRAPHHLCAEHLRLVQAQSQYLRLPLKVRDWLLRGCCLECAFLCAGEEPPAPGSPLQPRLSVEQAEELRLSLAPMLQLLLYPRGHSDEDLEAASFGNEVPVQRDDGPSDGGVSDLVGLPLRGRNWCFECGANTAVYLYKHGDDLSSEWVLCPPCWLALRNRPRTEGQPAGTSVPGGPNSSDPATMQLYCCLRREMLLRLQIMYPRVQHHQHQHLNRQAVLRPDDSRGSSDSGRQQTPTGRDPASTAGPSRPPGPLPPAGLPTSSAAPGHPGPAPSLFPSQCGPEILTEPYNRRIPLPGTHTAEALGLPPPPQAAVDKTWRNVTPPTDAVPYFHGALLRCAPHVSKADMQLVEEDYAYLVRKEAFLALPDERRRELLELARDHNARGGLVMFTGPMGLVSDPDGGMLDDVLAAMGVCEDGLRSSQAVAVGTGKGRGAGGEGSRAGGRTTDGRATAKGSGHERPLVGPLPWTMGAYEWSVKPCQASGAHTGRGASSDGAGGSGSDRCGGGGCSTRADVPPSPPPPLRDHTYGPVQLCCYDMAHRDDFGLGDTPVSVAFEPYQPHNREQQLGDEVNHAYQVDPTTLLRYMCSMINAYGVPTDPRYRQLRESCNSMRTSPAQELWSKLETAAAAEAEAETAARSRRTADEEKLDSDGGGPVDKADLLAMAQFGAHHAATQPPTLLPVAAGRRKRSAAKGTLQAPKRGPATAANGAGRESHAAGGGGAGADWMAACRVPLGLKVPVYPLTADDTLFMTSGDLMRLAHRMLMLHGPPWLRDILHERHNDALDFGTCRPADGGLGVFAHFANILERPQLATELATGSHVDRSQPATLMCFASPFAVPPPNQLEAQLDNLKRGLNASSAVFLLQRRNLMQQSRLQHPTAPEPHAGATTSEPLINAGLDRGPQRGSVWVVVPGCRLHQLAHAFNKTSKSSWPRNHSGYFTVRFGRDLERLVATCEQRGLPFHIAYHCEGDLLLPGMAAVHAVMPLHCASMKISQDFLAPAGPALRLIWELDVLRQEHHLKWASRRARDPRFRGGAARTDARLAKVWSEEQLAAAVAEQARIDQLHREGVGRQTQRERERERERGQSARREKGTGTGTTKAAATAATAQGLTGAVENSGDGVGARQHRAMPTASPLLASAVPEDVAVGDAAAARAAHLSPSARSCGGGGVGGVSGEVMQAFVRVDGAALGEAAPVRSELANHAEPVREAALHGGRCSTPEAATCVEALPSTAVAADTGKLMTGTAGGLTAGEVPVRLRDGVEARGVPFTASPPSPAAAAPAARPALHISADMAGHEHGGTQTATHGPAARPGHVDAPTPLEAEAPRSPPSREVSLKPPSDTATVEPLALDLSSGLCRCRELGQEGMDGCREHELRQPPSQRPPTAATRMRLGADSCVGGEGQSHHGVVVAAAGAAVDGALVAPHPALACLRSPTESVLAGMPSSWFQSVVSGTTDLASTSVNPDDGKQPVAISTLPGASPATGMQPWHRRAPCSVEEVRHVASNAATVSVKDVVEAAAKVRSVGSAAAAASPIAPSLSGTGAKAQAVTESAAALVAAAAEVVANAPTAMLTGGPVLQTLVAAAAAKCAAGAASHAAAAFKAPSVPTGPVTQAAVSVVPGPVAAQDSAGRHAAACCPVATRLGHSFEPSGSGRELCGQEVMASEHRVGSMRLRGDGNQAVIPASGNPQQQQQQQPCLAMASTTRGPCEMSAHVPPPAPALSPPQDFPRTTCIPSMAALGLGEYDSDDEAVREEGVPEQDKPATCPVDRAVDRAVGGLPVEGDVSVYASNAVTGTDAVGAHGGYLDGRAPGEQPCELHIMELPPPAAGIRQGGQLQVSDIAAAKWCNPATWPSCLHPLPDTPLAPEALTLAIRKWTNCPEAASGSGLQLPEPQAPAQHEAAQVPSSGAAPATEAAGPLLVLGSQGRKERVRGLIRNLLPITASGCHSQVGARLLTLAESTTAAAGHASALTGRSHVYTATIRHEGGIPGMISMASEAAAVAATAGPCITLPCCDELYPAPVPSYQIASRGCLLAAIHPQMFELSPDADALRFDISEEPGAQRRQEHPVSRYVPPLLNAPSDPAGGTGYSCGAGRPLDLPEHVRSPHADDDTHMEGTGCRGSEGEMEDDLPLASLAAGDRVGGSQGGTRRVGKVGAGGLKGCRPAPAGRKTRACATATGSDEEGREGEDADEEGEEEEEEEDRTRFEEELPAARKRQRGAQAAAGRPQGGAAAAKKARSGSANKAQGRAASRKAAGGAAGQGALLAAMEDDGGGAAAAPQSEWAQALVNARDSFLTQSLLVGLALAVSYTLSDLELRRHRAGGHQGTVGVPGAAETTVGTAL